MLRMVQIRTYTPDQQQAIIERYAVLGVGLLSDQLAATTASVVDDAVAITVGKGLAEYGDAAFHQSVERLADEAHQELVDACFRTAIIGWVRDGRPLVP